MEGFKSSLTSEQIEKKLLESGIGVIDATALTSLSSSSTSEEIKSVADNLYQQYKDINGPFVAIIKMQEDPVSASISPIDISFYGQSETTFHITFIVPPLVYDSVGGGMISCLEGEYSFSYNYSLTLTSILSVGSTLRLALGGTVFLMYDNFDDGAKMYSLEIQMGIPIANLMAKNSAGDILISPIEQIAYYNGKQYNIKCTLNDENKRVEISTSEL